MKSNKLSSLQLWTQFLQLRLEAWKFQDFNGAGRLSKKSFVGFHMARDLLRLRRSRSAASRPKGSLRSPRGRLAASLRSSLIVDEKCAELLETFRPLGMRS